MYQFHIGRSPRRPAILSSKVDKALVPSAAYNADVKQQLHVSSCSNSKCDEVSFVF